MTILDLLRDMHSQCKFNTKEGKKVGAASNSELKRWTENKAVIVNNKAITNPFAVIELPLRSLVLFPKHPISLYYNMELIQEDCIEYLCAVFDDTDKMDSVRSLIDCSLLRGNNIRDFVCSLNFTSLNKLHSIV